MSVSLPLSELSSLFTPCYARGVMLPPLLAIYEPERCALDIYSYIHALPPGAAMVFRGYTMPDRAMYIVEAAKLAAQCGIPFFPACNYIDHMDVVRMLLRAAIPIAGVHIAGNQKDELTAIVRDVVPNIMISRGAHNMHEIRCAEEASTDICLLSPLFPTHTHKDALPLGAAIFSDMIAHTSLPIYALGGVVSPKHVHIAADMGAAGIASIGLFSGV